ncbi:ring-opening amidohydrolase [Glutamicibacter uratoxydans]|uniref:ring-opening amidohydrolase n=1 Tax=Glutamicibacter uratoxydans TaxID=43667 RepID=UPI001477871D|nr:ring-opening amidohydrolase [Glutamicibacter uratoxydans]
MSDVTPAGQPTAIDIFTAPLEHESDTTVLSQLISDGVIDPAQIVAVTGKVEGNTPGENSRGNAMDAVRRLLTGAAKLPEEHVAQIPFVLSSGGVGILSPHLAVYTRSPWEGPVGESRLVLGTALSDPILPEWVGRRQTVEQVAATVHRAAQQAGIAPEDAEYVLTKNRGVSAADIQEAAARGVRIEPFDRAHATAQTTGGAALGIAVATGAIAMPDESAIGFDGSLYSPVASCSAGNENERSQVVLLGNSAAAGGSLRVGHAVMHDLLDITALHRALRSAGMDIADGAILSPAQRARVKALYVKVGTPIEGRLRGRRQVHQGQNPAYFNELKAAVAGAYSVFMQDTIMYISNAAFHQGPEGGGTVAAIVSQR